MYLLILLCTLRHPAELKSFLYSLFLSVVCVLEIKQLNLPQNKTFKKVNFGRICNMHYSFTFGLSYLPLLARRFVSWHVSVTNCRSLE